MRKSSHKERAQDEHALEAGIEWIVARQLAPLQDEVMRLRTTVEVLRELISL